MPIREPRKMDVYISGKFYRRFCSVRDAVKFLGEHWGISFSATKYRVNNACKKNDGYFKNFRFVKDPDYVTSRLVVASNLVTGEYMVFPSVGKAGEYVFGGQDIHATARISRLCKNGGIHDGSGFTFKYIENGYVFSPSIHDTTVMRPILQLNKNAGAVISYFHSVCAAVEYIYDLGVSRMTKRNIAVKISTVADGKNPNEVAPFGFKWCYVGHDESAENIPLPEPNEEGL